MGKSLFVSVDQLCCYQISADNLLIAKYMHDNGTPLSLDTQWYLPYSNFIGPEDSIFTQAIQELLGPTEYKEESEEEPRFADQHIFHTESQLLEEWCGLKQKLSKEILEREEKYIIGTAAKMWCSYFDYECCVEIVGNYFEIILNGSYGLHNDFIKELIEMRKRLSRTIAKWQRIGDDRYEKSDGCCIEPGQTKACRSIGVA